ncbi:MAG TPA: hypothetical protein VGF25_05665, partial [Thermoleophilaceae bacterium]
MPHARPLSSRLAAAVAAALALAALVPAGASAATNNIFTVAGTTAGLSGNGGPATQAQLFTPSAVSMT